MPSFGKSEYCSGKDDEWHIYIARLEQYLVANDLDAIVATENNAAALQARDVKWRAILLSVIGNSTYTTVRSLCSLDKPMEKSYNELITLLNNHFSPTPSETVQRFKFHTCIRQEGTSVASYLSVLRQLSENCNFENQLENMLRDRLVCGINDDKIQTLLLVEPQLTLDKAYNICLAQEHAIRDTKSLQGAASSVNKVTLTKSSKTIHKGGSKQYKMKDSVQRHDKQCYRCGDPNHLANSCKHKSTTCNYCGRVGHLKKVCFKCEKEENEANAVEVDTEEMTGPEMTMYTVNSSHPPVHIELLMNETPVQFQLDTGAGVSIMNYSDFKCKLPDCNHSRSNVALKSYSGDRINVKGETDVQIKLDDQVHTLPLVVVDGTGPPLLGRTWLNTIRLPWEKIV